MIIEDYASQYILGILIIQERGIPMDKPGFNGMMGILNIAHMVFFPYLYWTYIHEMGFPDLAAGVPWGTPWYHHSFSWV